VQTTSPKYKAPLLFYAGKMQLICYNPLLAMYTYPDFTT